MVWHELVLNGIGGRTIEEAKFRLSYAEFRSWVAYRKKFGSLSFARHYEWGNALLTMKIHNAHYTDKKEMTHFMPHYEEPVATIHDAFKILSRK